MNASLLTPIAPSGTTPTPYLGAMPVRRAAFLAGVLAYAIAHDAHADADVPFVMPPDAPERPHFQLNRWQEDWSALSDANLRTEPFDRLKYIPLSSEDSHSYASIGLDLRERMESTQVAPFGIGDARTNTYGLQRLDMHADIRPDAHWQLFVQLQDDRAVAKDLVTPVDKDPLDLEQFFVSYTNEVAGGTFKVRAGRQQMGFDLQRFVGVRDGPNVRQSFDAMWADWEKASWRIITFWSHPVQDVTDSPFDDYSSPRLQYGGFRVERSDVGPGNLSAYYSRYAAVSAQDLDGAGTERRDNLDLRYQVVRGTLDWDFEGMHQTGRVGGEPIRALALGSRGGYTFADAPWNWRFGLQFDLATGYRQRDNGIIETFNPLFPNAYYFTLAGAPTYANLIHVRPSLEARPLHNLKVIAGIGLQWRETTADAVYVIPNRPLPTTAGLPGRWTGVYEQVRSEWAINSHWAASIEGVQYQVGDVVRRAGGTDTNYLGVELRLSW